MRNKIVSIVIAILVGMFVAGCGSNNPAENAVKKFVVSEQLRNAYIEMSKRYEEGVKKETDISATYQKWQEKYSNMITAAGDSYKIVQGCYKNTEEAVAKMAAGVFGTDASGNPLSPGAENTAFINALATGGSSVYGAEALARCQDEANKLSDYMRVERTKLMEGDRTLLIDQLRNYTQWQRDTLVNATATRFLNQYGPVLTDLAMKGEGYILDQVAAEAQITPLPIDFIGFPTAAMQAKSKSQALCNQYMSIYAGQAPAPMGRQAAMYQSEWVIAGGGYCLAYRQAAWEIMDSLFISTQAATRLDCGTDAGALEEVNKDCETNPLPTDTP